MLGGLRPMLPFLAVVVVLLLVVALPLPGRGPRMFQRRDPWRGYRFGSRREVLERAGGRCEGPQLLAWGRCRAEATEVDHVYPWSRGGPTTVSNGQALCRVHNRRKSNLRPPWWYVLSLERRRANYVPSGTETRVLARMNAEERAARQSWAARRR
ncbi:MULTISPECIES: HNH endonuclease [Nocardioides]